MTDTKTFAAVQYAVLRRIADAQKRQIADLKRQLSDSIQRERAARRQIYTANGGQHQNGKAEK